MELRKTEQRLLEAVSQIIEENGFAKIGVNRIAKQAGCDKVLIYRYFGGLEGLLAAWASKHDFYTFAYNSFVEKVQGVEQTKIKDLAKEVLIEQLEYLKDNFLMQELLVWELSGDASFDAIRKEREKNGQKLQKEFENRFQNEMNDYKIHITILISAINFIVLFTRQYNMINGIDFNKPSSWELLKGAICNYIDMMLNTTQK